MEDSVYLEERHTHIDHAHELIEWYADPDSKGHNRWVILNKDTGECSAGLLQKFYFVREGVIRDKHLYRGQFYDHDCYSLLRREWTGSQQ
ncbi:GNAT family N-acetyltransferase [Paenibacillus apiarius]|uniref:GNAT family N-acetyltransferase n=1 Tax=Paenibacillus apiarius TaxID=46240 RepID=UPI0019811E7E|nr:GNAT family protein [Paenibacillus apiarius]MBN3522541.1 GNAT family N-acetyltransferase [Paenibacillus apiarius]